MAKGGKRRMGDERVRPNILLILNDDMGFSDLGCYGGEVHTPNIDRLAQDGLRFTHFYNTARCCPSRASLLTGLHPHQVNVGHMMQDDGVDGYRGDLVPECATIAELLGDGGYATYMSGKWHVTRHVNGPQHSWPRQRGFDHYYGIITGASSYYDPITLTRENERIEPPAGPFYLTDAISDQMAAYIDAHGAAAEDCPFFGYLAYTAPHWPLQADEADIAIYEGCYDCGWDDIRRQRLERMVAMGLIAPHWKLSGRDVNVPPWSETEDQAWQARRMAVYAAQIERMDRGIGRVLAALDRQEMLDNTLILFLADNGGCAEELTAASAQWLVDHSGFATTRDGRPVRYGNDPQVMPGPDDTYQSCGVPWANVSNTPFREYKHWVHEGGIATPLIVHWPAGIAAKSALCHQPGQLPDIMATCLDAAGAEYPEARQGCAIPPLEGQSLLPAFAGACDEGKTLYWEHEGNRAVRQAKWKLVCKYPGPWELYDIEQDRTELHDLSGEHPEVVEHLAALHDAWAQRCNVLPWEALQRMRRAVASD